MAGRSFQLLSGSGKSEVQYSTGSHPLIRLLPSTRGSMWSARRGDLTPHETVASPTACDRPRISMSRSYLPSSSPVLRCVRGLGGSTARCSSQVCPQRAHQQKLLPFGAWRRRESPSHRGQGRHSPSSVIALVALQGSRQISNISVIRQKVGPVEFSGMPRHSAAVGSSLGPARQPPPLAIRALS